LHVQVVPDESPARGRLKWITLIGVAFSLVTVAALVVWIVAHEAMVRELGDQALLGSFLARVGHRYWTFARYEEARSALNEASENYERYLSITDAAAVYTILEWTHQQLGEYEPALLARDKALEKLETSFHPIWYSFARCGALLAYAWTGQRTSGGQAADGAD
jgi:tetratricopeptide (TPR) repeat protein